MELQTQRSLSKYDSLEVGSYNSWRRRWFYGRKHMSKVIKLYVHCRYVLRIISMIHQYIPLKHESHRCSLHPSKETDHQDPGSSICTTAHLSRLFTFPGITLFFYVSCSFNLKCGSYDFSQTSSYSGLSHRDVKYHLSKAEAHFISLLGLSPFPGLGKTVHNSPPPPPGSPSGYLLNIPNPMPQAEF